MNRKLTLILVVVGILCIVLNILKLNFGEIFAPAITFPFEPIAGGLRALSLSCAAGNIIAIIFYCAICLLPIAYGTLRLYKETASGYDFLLVVMSIVMFVVIYFMINPADILRHLISNDNLGMNNSDMSGILEIYKSSMALVIYTIVLAYIVFRLFHHFSVASSSRLLNLMNIILAIACVIIIASAMGPNFSELISQLANANNTNAFDHVYEIPWETPVIPIEPVIIALKYIIDQLPSIFVIVIIYRCRTLLHTIGNNRFSKDAIENATAVAAASRISVFVIVLSQLCMNLLVFAVGSMISNHNFELNIPFMSIAFAISAMLAAKWFEQNSKLKDEVDSFV